MSEDKLTRLNLDMESTNQLLISDLKNGKFNKRLKKRKDKILKIQLMAVMKKKSYL